MIFKLEPYFSTRVWGGSKINKIYGYDCPSNTGEAWGISAHKNGASYISNTIYKGKSLREIYKSNRELFGNHPSDEFPILIKVIDALDDLSIQVHPDNDYARANENSLGKTESWIILDTEENTDIIIGNNAKNIEEFKEYVRNNDFESVINRFSIKKGDIFNIYAGTIHAICKGTLLLEIQQSSDITYRLYDYNRLSNGKLRELHLDKAFDVIKCPDLELNPNCPTDYFDFDIISNKGINEFEANIYGDYIFIMDGVGSINDMDVKKGNFLIVTSKDDYLVQGNLKYFRAIIK